MRALIAPDKFKGCLSARDVAAGLARGLACTGVGSTVLPLADGGDGSVDAALNAGFAAHRVAVSAAFGRVHDATIAVHADGTAVVEIANTCGLGTYGGAALDALRASSYGFGQAIRAAVTAGARRIVLALGGSASTDGGTGMLAALGFEFRDIDGGLLEPDGANLMHIHTVVSDHAVDMSGIDLILASDVPNVLLGPAGAAAVFAPQKGARDDDIAALEVGLATLVSAWNRVGDVDARKWAITPGSGSAGGCGFAAIALGARVTSGANYFLDLLDFDTHCRAADVVITGEGRLDTQTLSGKLPAAVARRADPLTTIAVVGANSLKEPQSLFDSVYAVSDICDTLDPQATGRAIEAIGQRIGLRYNVIP